MTTPVVATTSNGTFSGTTVAVTQPTVVNAGDLLIALMGGDGTPTVDTIPSGYNVMYDTSSNGCFVAAFWKDADGTEDSQVVNFELSASENGGWQCYRITGAGDPAVAPPFISSVSQGVSSSPTPSSIDPPGTKDFLYLIHGGFDRASYITGAPTGYSNIITSTQTGAQDGNSSVCEKATTASDSDTPGSATTNTSDGYNIYTIAIDDGSGTLHEATLTAAAVASGTFTPVATWAANLVSAAVASMVLPSSVEHPASVTIAAQATLLADSQNLKIGVLTAAGVTTMVSTGITTLAASLTITGASTVTLTAQNLKQGVLAASSVSVLTPTAQNLKQAVLTADAVGASTYAVTMDYAAQLSVNSPATVSLTAQADYIVQLSVYSPATFSRLYGGYNIPAV
ncbi:MAG: hypothetical protein ACXABY_16785, partial [Candidatus Thorarchaeota archaeon]